MRRWRTKPLLRGVLIGTSLLLVAGVIAEQVGRSRDRHKFPQVGTSFDIGGRSLNIHCLGEGSPVVVFDTFSHLAGYNWIAVQAEVAKFTRACWYDRAGYGWSDPGPLYASATQVAADLHALLTAATVQLPYVLVGQGDVALQIRVYTGAYPKEIVGAVFVSGNDVTDRPEPPMFARPGVERFLGSWALPPFHFAACSAMSLIARIGLLRLGRPRGTWSYSLTPEQQIEADFLSDNPTAYRHTATALCVQDRSRVDASTAKDLGDIPLRVVVSGERIGDGTPLDAEDLKMAEADHEYELHTYQPRLAAWSRRGKLVVTKRAIVAADVIDAVHDVVSEASHR